MKMSVDQALRRARSLSPEAALALYGEMLARFPANKRLQEAFADLSRPAIVSPPEAALDAVIALYEQGRLADAEVAAGTLVAAFPHSEVLRNIAGAICAASGDPAAAVAHYDHAVMLAPDYFEAWSNRGNALNDLGRGGEAVASFDRAIALAPEYAAAHMNRGIALRGIGRAVEALASGSTAIRLDPTCAEAYSTRGNCLLALGRAADALADFDTAIALRHRFADAHVNRGNALMALGRGEEALASYDACIAIAPAHLHAHANRGRALRRLKRLDEAYDAHRRAAEIAPGSVRAAAEARDVAAHMCRWRDAGAIGAGEDADAVAIGVGEDAVPPFSMLGLADDPEAQLACARAWSARQFGAIPATPIRPRRRNDGRIRLGYFSADFHNHPVMHLIARLFELHDRSRFEVHAFSHGPAAADAMRTRLIAGVDQFHPVEALGDAAVAELARSKGIDIAVDLSGHTEGGRLGILAHRAAAVQIGYLGYPGTVGADFLDYVIADPVTVPAGAERFFTETVVRLPHCYQPNDDRRAIAERRFTRSELGLPERGFVFCCFNAVYKITPAAFAIWMRLLAQVEGSVLWLLDDNRWARDNLRAEAAARGIAPERLVFAGRMPPAEHLARHAAADLFLDTFTYNAHTTASDALWAGLPVLTLPGRSFAARVGASLVSAVGMPELIAGSAADYERIALAIATDPARAAALKAKLAEPRAATPLFDAGRYARDIEALYERCLGGAAS